MEKKINYSEKYLHFHKGRGGVITFEGEEDLQTVIRRYNDRIFVQDRDPRTGRFQKKVLVDCNGNEVCDTPNAMAGVLDFDGDYDSHIVMTMDEVTNLAEYGETKWADAIDFDGWLDINN